MNKYFKLLIYFQRNKKVAQSFLLKKPGITKEIINESLDNGYIMQTDNNKNIKYVITEEGIKKRDN